MVRHKVRWILTKMDFEKDLSLTTDNEKKCHSSIDMDKVIITTKEITLALRAIVNAAFGVAGIGIIEGFQGTSIYLYPTRSITIHRFIFVFFLSFFHSVRMYDSDTQLAIVKVPRHACSIIRSALTLITTILGLPVVASTISINGSVRTAKIAALHHIQQIYNNKMLSFQKTSPKDTTSTWYRQHYSNLQSSEEKIKQWD